MVSDSQLRAQVRRDLGLTDTDRVPDSIIDAEIQRMRAAFPSEAEEAALRWLVDLRCLPLARGESRIPPTHPQALSQLRRTSFPNENPSYWQQQLNKSLSNDGY